MINIGDNIGQFTILSMGKQNNRLYYDCLCSCGNTKLIRKDHLISKSIISCGCYKSKRNTKDNRSDSELYQLWRNVISHCYNIKNPKYSYYGGRGITVCDEWKIDPFKFYEWANNNNFTPSLELDRINNLKGYSPENCRFVTKQQNNFNKQGNYSASSKYKGVSIHNHTGKWRARIKLHNKEMHIGLFNSEIDAAKAYDHKALELFGEYAYLNFGGNYELC